MLSHPKKELINHLEEVCMIGMSIFDNKDNIYCKDKNIRKFLEIVLKNHDAGKATSYFQNYIKNPEGYKENESLKSHSLLSALVTYYKIINEIEGDKKRKLAILGFYIVLKHHGYLGNLEENIFFIKNSYKTFLKKQLDEFNYTYFSLDKKNFNKFVEEFKNYDFDDELDEIKENKNFKEFLFINYMFSILISADKGATIYASNNKNLEELKKIILDKKIISKDIVDNYKLKKGFKVDSNLNIIRENIYKEIEKEILKDKESRIFSINVPTGTGKTLASFNASLKLKDKLGGNYKIIYTLPFTSVIDQNFSIFEEILGEEGKDSKNLLKHHYLSQKNYKNEEESLTYDVSEYLIENWDSQIIVTTFIQLFQTLFSNKNRNLKKFHSFSNAIIILDEIQAIPHKYWTLLNEFLKVMLEEYNSYLIFVTATMPLIFSEEKKEIKELATNKINYFQELNRIQLDKNLIKNKIRLEEFSNELTKELKNNEKNSYLIVLNTIKSSTYIYNEIKKRCENREVYYLSTSIIPKERASRINKIKKLLTQGKVPILISTQLIEAGVDIDFDVVYRDFSTLDSINQTCGRCNRNAKKLDKGRVKLFKLCDERQEYSKYIYDNFLLEKTNKVLNEISEEKILEKNFYSISQKYFLEVKINSSDEESRRLIENLKKLEYEKLNDKKRGFILIPEVFKTTEVFIEIDDEAKLLKNEYLEINKIENKYLRKEKFDKIKSNFLNYVISVPEIYYREGKDKENIINFIDEESLDFYYDKEIGFKREEKIEDYIF